MFDPTARAPRRDKPNSTRTYILLAMFLGAFGTLSCCCSLFFMIALPEGSTRDAGGSLDSREAISAEASVRQLLAHADAGDRQSFEASWTSNTPLEESSLGFVWDVLRVQERRVVWGKSSCEGASEARTCTQELIFHRPEEEYGVRLELELRGQVRDELAPHDVRTSPIHRGEGGAWAPGWGELDQRLSPSQFSQRFETVAEGFRGALERLGDPEHCRAGYISLFGEAQSSAIDQLCAKYAGDALPEADELKYEEIKYQGLHTVEEEGFDAAWRWAKGMAGPHRWTVIFDAPKETLELEGFHAEGFDGQPRVLILRVSRKQK